MIISINKAYTSHIYTCLHKCYHYHRTYVGWKYALLIEIIILSLFFLTIVIPTYLFISLKCFFITCIVQQCGRYAVYGTFGCILGCHIALGFASRYITSSDTTSGPIYCIYTSLLYYIIQYIMMIFFAIHFLLEPQVYIYPVCICTAGLSVQFRPYVYLYVYLYICVCVTKKMSVLYLAGHNSSQKPVQCLLLRFMSPKIPSIASEPSIKRQI